MSPNALPYWTAAAYGVLAALAIVVGGGLVRPTQPKARGSYGVLAAIAAGFLLALGLLGALPEALEHSASPLVPIAIAIASLAVVMFLHRAGHAAGHQHGAAGGHEHAHAHGHEHAHTVHAPDAHEHEHKSEPAAPAPPHAAEAREHGPSHDEASGHTELSLHDANLAVGGLALHSLLDGVAVSAALASRRELGMFVAFFVLLHKMPEGATAAALTYASGGQAQSARRGVWIVAAASLLGALAIFVIGPVLYYALAITAGVTSGVSFGIATHLLKRDARTTWIGMLIGALIFVASERLIHH